MAGPASDEIPGEGFPFEELLDQQPSRRGSSDQSEASTGSGSQRRRRRSSSRQASDSADPLFKEQVLRDVFGDVGSLLRDFSCAWDNKTLVHGRMYITQEFLCFYSTWNNLESKVVLAYENLSRCSKSNSVLVIPNAIIIQEGRDKTYIFRNFWERDDCFNLIQNLMADAGCTGDGGRNGSAATTPTASPPTRNTSAPSILVARENGRTTALTVSSAMVAAVLEEHDDVLPSPPLLPLAAGATAAAATTPSVSASAAAAAASTSGWTLAEGCSQKEGVVRSRRGSVTPPPPKRHGAILPAAPVEAGPQSLPGSPAARMHHNIVTVAAPLEGLQEAAVAAAAAAELPRSRVEPGSGGSAEARDKQAFTSPTLSSPPSAAAVAMAAATMAAEVRGKGKGKGASEAAAASTAAASPSESSSRSPSSRPRFGSKATAAAKAETAPAAQLAATETPSAASTASVASASASASAEGAAAVGAALGLKWGEEETEAEAKANRAAFERAAEHEAAQALVVTAEFPVSVKDFWHAFMADDAPYGLHNFHLTRGDWDVDASLWQPAAAAASADGVAAPVAADDASAATAAAAAASGTAIGTGKDMGRALRFKTPLNLSFMAGPSQVRTCKQQRCRVFGGAGFIVDTLTTVEDRIPLSDHFGVEDRWLLQPAGDSGGRCRATVRWRCVWHKFTMIRGLIEAKCKGDVRSFNEAFVRGMAEHLAGRAAGPGGLSRARSLQAMALAAGGAGGAAGGLSSVASGVGGVGGGSVCSVGGPAFDDGVLLLPAGTMAEARRAASPVQRAVVLAGPALRVATFFFLVYTVVYWVLAQLAGGCSGLGGGGGISAASPQLACLYERWGGANLALAGVQDQAAVLAAQAKALRQELASGSASLSSASAGALARVQAALSGVDRQVEAMHGEARAAMEAMVAATAQIHALLQEAQQLRSSNGACPAAPAQPRRM